MDAVQAKVEKGSYRLHLVLPMAIASLLTNDLRLLAQRQEVLGEVDEKRAEVVQRWQAQAKKNPDLVYEVRPDDARWSVVRVSHESDYRVGRTQPWVRVEKYLVGEILDMGGAQVSNIHLRLEESGKTLIISAGREILQSQTRNLLYSRAVLRIEAEQHLQSGVLRNARLLSFIDYQPEYDEAGLDAFAAEGEKAWGDIPDPVRWIRDLRGN